VCSSDLSSSRVAYNPTMLRWTFHILTLMSLVLMIASCVAWVRSGIGNVSDSWWQYQGGEVYDFTIGGGYFIYTNGADGYFMSQSDTHWQYSDAVAQE